MPLPVLEVHGVSKLYSHYRPKPKRGERLPERSGADPASLDAQEAGPKPNTFWALKDIDLSIPPGGSLGVVGRNGSGKTTLLKMISRVVRPTGGTIIVRGHRHSLLEIGTGFHPELTGRKNVYLNGAILGFRKREVDARLERIVAFSGIGLFLDSPVKFYSAGMYVRLAFSIGTHFEPDLLILDEVVSVGDAAFQERCQDKIAETLRAGCALLLVSHEISKITTLCKQAIWLKGGKIAATGPSSEVCEAYLGRGTVAVEGPPVPADRPHD